MAQPDVANKAIEANTVKYGGIVAGTKVNGTQSTYSPGKTGVYGIQPSGAYLKYDTRFDDTTYYTA
jgi:hypothetical protein